MYKAKSLSPNLMVDDVASTMDFYSKYLGFETVMTVPQEGELNWAMVKKDNIVLMFQAKENLLEEYPQMQSSIGASLSLYCDVEGVEAFYENVKDTVEICKDLHVTFYGKKEFAIKDCNGYLITFSEDANC